MEQGWISLHRKITEHPLYKEKRCFSKIEAWVDLLLLVNHKDNTIVIGNEIVNIKRGSKITSITSLAKRWDWSRTKVKNYLDFLQNDGMITHKSTSKYTLINIRNYENYQGCNIVEKHQKDIKSASEKHQKDTNNNDNNINNDNKNNISQYTKEFEELWNIYPKKVDKLKSFKCYKTLIKEGYTHDNLLKAVTSYTNQTKKQDTDVKYIKHLSTFLGPNKPFLEYLGGNTDGSNNEEDRGKIKYDKSKWLYKG